MRAEADRRERAEQQPGRRGLGKEMTGLREEERRRSVHVHLTNIGQKLIVDLSTFLAVTIQRIS